MIHSKNTGKIIYMKIIIEKKIMDRSWTVDRTGDQWTATGPRSDRSDSRPTLVSI